MEKKTHIFRFDVPTQENELGQKLYRTHCGRYVSIHRGARDDEIVSCKACRGAGYFISKLKVDIIPEEITISIAQSELEVVKWTEDEWQEDPTIVPAIANAILMAKTTPDLLIHKNIKHIDSQLQIRKEHETS
jgi:hypothetical protein